jgi:hypothetical protein
MNSPNKQARRVASQYLSAQTRLARRHLQAKRVAAAWVQAEDALQTKFDSTVGETKVKNPATGRDIKLKGFLSKIKGASKAMVTAVKSAPAATQKMMTDPVYRKEQTKAAAKALKALNQKGGEAVVKAVWGAMKSEAGGVFKETPKIMFDLAKDNAKGAAAFAKLPKEEQTKENFASLMRKPTKDEVKTIYGSAVYAGGIALAMAGGPAGAGIAGLAAAGASAFAHSFTLHVGIKAVGSMLDDGFLGYEAAETVAGSAAELGAESMSGLLPSSGALYGFSPWSAIQGGLDVVKEVGSMVLGAEESKDEDKVMQDFITKLTGAMADALDKGISDEDMQNILAENHGLPA